MPFLYQTRTILRIPARRASKALERSLHATPYRLADEIPFEYETGPPIDDPSAQPPNTRGTITPSERQVFERIFADIKARGLKPAVTEEQTKTNSAAQRSTMLIMQQAAYDAGQSRPATITAPGLLAGAAKDRAKALLRFPPELRGAARKALDTIQSQAGGAKRSDSSEGEIEFSTGPMPTEDEGEVDLADNEWAAPAGTFQRTIEVEQKRHDERTRIEGLITSARSDFELWDVMESEVFSMPARLGIAKPPTDADGSTSAVDTKSHNSKKGKKVKKVEQAEEKNELSLYIHGPLYPAYLLLGLRRLDTAFPAPSTLAFSVLPRIKELGLESYVLGVSTPFFNELLDIYWTRRADLAGVLDILEEMRHCGLYFDRQSQGILHRIEQAVFGLASHDSKNSFGRALMDMPDYEHSQRTRIKYWSRAVQKSIAQRVDDIGYQGGVTAV